MRPKAWIPRGDDKSRPGSILVPDVEPAKLGNYKSCVERYLGRII